MVFGLVKVLTTTEYDSGEIQKAKVLGKLANKLLKNLHYKDTIAIEYRQMKDPVLFPGFKFIEIGNTQQSFLHFGSITRKSQKLSHKFGKPLGICIRQIANSLNITNTLKILEYCVLNKASLKPEIIKYYEIRFNDFDKMYYEKHRLLGINQTLINKILKEKTSNLINELFIIAETNCA